MLRASDYDRFYRILGVEPGGSLSEIEAQWKLCCAAVHPDKFAADAKARATTRIQEINNARDELRRYWRRHGGPPPTSIGDGLQMTTVRLRENPVDEDISPSDAAQVAQPADAARLVPTPAAAAPKQWHRVSAFAAVAAVVGAIGLVAGGLMQQDASRPRHAGPAAALLLAPSSGPLEPPRSAASFLPTSRLTAAPAKTVGTKSATSALSEVAPPVAPPISDPSRATQPATSPARDLSAGSTLPADPWLSIVEDPPAAPRSTVGQGSPAAKSSGIATLPPPELSSPVAPPATTSPQPHWQRATSYTRREELRYAALDACRSDLRTLCAGVQPGAGRIARCAREHFWQLSSGCSGALLALRNMRIGGAGSSER